MSGLEWLEAASYIVTIAGLPFAPAPFPPARFSNLAMSGAPRMSPTTSMLTRSSRNLP